MLGNPCAINLSASVQRDDVHQFLATKRCQQQMSQPVLRCWSRYFCHPRCRWANDSGSISYLVFSIVTCAESIAWSTISETLLSPLFRRGSRSNHIPKLILWLGLKSSTPIARAISFIGTKRRFAAPQHSVAFGAKPTLSHARSADFMTASRQ
jgi:hypothetical protein